MPQEPFLFDDTIAANLGFARPGSSLADMEAVARASTSATGSRACPKVC